MSNRRSVSLLARTTPSTEAHNAIISVGDLLSLMHLCANPHLSEAHWFKIWDVVPEENQVTYVTFLAKAAHSKKQQDSVLGFSSNQNLAGLLDSGLGEVNPALAIRICEKLSKSKELNNYQASACIKSGHLKRGQVLKFLLRLLSSTRADKSSGLSSSTTHQVDEVLSSAANKYGLAIRLFVVCITVKPGLLLRQTPKIAASIGSGSDLSALDPDEVDLTEEYIVEDLTPTLDALGAAAWSLFLQLLPGWKAGLGSLLDIVKLEST